jgi:hypothetical protein
MEFTPKAIEIQDPSSIYDFVTPPAVDSLNHIESHTTFSKATSTFRITSLGNMLISGNTLLSTTAPAGIVLGIIDNPEAENFSFSLIQTTPIHPDAMLFNLPDTPSSSNMLNKSLE